MDKARIKAFFAGLVKFLPKNWRELVAWAAIAATSALITKLTGEKLDVPVPPVPLWERPPDGYIPPSAEQIQATLATLPNPYFADTEAGEANDDFFADAPEAFLWRGAEKGAMRPIRVINQGQYGTCVGCASAKAIELRLGMQALSRRGPPQAVPEINVAYVYGVGRVDGNGGRCPPELRGGDGSYGACAIRGMQAAGSLDAAIHGTYDLTIYNGDLCRKWGDNGVPPELKAIGKPNKLASFSQVRTTTELKKSLLQGYPVLTCSRIGFNNPQDERQKPVRDANGLLRESGEWGHAMVFVGYRLTPTPSFCVWNSWGEDWCQGPVGYGDCPKWCFWVDEPTAGRMVGQGRASYQQDSWAVAGVEGFRRKKLVADDWIVERPLYRPSFLQFGELYAFGR